MPNEFYTGTDWEQSSGPICDRAFALGDLWPEGLASEIGGGNKDVLVDGLHPILAVGLKADRAVDTLTGVVMTYNANAAIVQLNIATGFCSRQYVANIITYAAAYKATYDIGDLVYVDDSADLSPGVTLSLSPLNSAGSANPLAGILFYAQDEYLDSGVGGENASALWPKTASAEALVESLLTVMLTD